MPPVLDAGTDRVVPVHILHACAMAAHEVNRAYCQAMNDNTQVPWESAPEWQRTSVFQGVRGILLRNNSPEESHAGWMAHKLADGWVWGPVKDPEQKKHPCLVPYKDLPIAQQHKDHLFASTVRAVASALGW